MSVANVRFRNEVTGRESRRNVRFMVAELTSGKVGDGNRYAEVESAEASGVEGFAH